MGKQIFRNERGELIYENGDKVNTRDYLLTTPYIPRFYDFQTKNQSAINLHVLFKKIGLKNNKEHLQIFDPTLIGVDPWDPLLKDNVKQAIVKECVNNYWYIYREIFKVNNGSAPFDLNIFNYTAIYFMLRNVNFFAEASRQIGKTQIITAHSAIEFNFSKFNHMAVAHYDSKMGSDNIGKIDEVLTALPSWMHFYDKIPGKVNKKTGQIEIKAKTRSATKKESMINEFFNNVIELKVVGQVESKANNTGRGTTIPVWFIDEVPHIKYNDVAFEALNQATKEAKESAKAENRPFGYRLLGTPGKMETREGSWMYNNIKNSYILMNENSLEVLDMTEDEIADYAREKSTDGIFHIKYDFDKIGKDADWLSARCQGQSVDGIRSELLLIWEDTSSSSPFPATELATLTNYSDKKVSREYRLNEYIPGLNNEDLTIKIFEVTNTEMYEDWVSFFSLNFRDGIVVGVDVSRGLGGPNDSTVYSFVDAKTGAIIGLIKDNTLEINDLTVLTKSLCEIAIANGIKMALSIENNDGMSNALIQSIKYLPQVQPFLIPFPVSQWKLNSQYDTSVDFEYLDDAGIKQKLDFGYSMDGKGRDKIISLIQLLVRKYSRCISIPELVEELKTLVIYTKRGTNGMVTKIAAAAGKHDDVVMSVGHAYHALYYHASILRNRHGIEVDLDKWLINENTIAFSFANRPASSRISVTFKEIDGEFFEIFMDNKTNKIVSSEEAAAIFEEELGNKKDRYMSGSISGMKEVELVEEKKVIDPVETFLKERLEARTSSNVKIVTKDEYNEFKEGLAYSNNIYTDSMNSLMEEMMSGM